MGGGVDLFYWHPGRKDVRALGLSTAGHRMEGTLTFDGDTATIDYEFFSHFFQPGEHRPLTARWDFRGPDTYHFTVLENHGTRLAPLVELDYARSQANTLANSVEVETRPAEHLKLVAPLVGHTWMSAGDSGGSDAAPSATMFE